MLGLVVVNDIVYYGQHHPSPLGLQDNRVCIHMFPGRGVPTMRLDVKSRFTGATAYDSLESGYC